MLKRVVIKLSGEALSVKDGVAYDKATVSRIAQEISEVAKKTQVSLVLGGGNLWRGRDADSSIDRSRSDQIGMLGTVMNALYFSEYLRLAGTQAVVMTPFAISSFTQIFSKDAALEYLEKGSVVINAAGLGHPFFSTDTITALRAAELEADCVLYAKSVDGIFQRDPRKDSSPENKKYKFATYDTVIRNNLDAADIAAMNISMSVNMASYMFDLKQPGGILAACTQDHFSGTFVKNNIKEEFYV